MPKKRIIFYTDCFIFGGCERPIFEIMAAPDFYSAYDYFLIYRFTKEYEEGRSLFSPGIREENIKRVRLCDIHSWHYSAERAIPADNLAGLVKRVISLLFRFLRPFIFMYELAYLYFLFLRNQADIVHINNGGYPGTLSCRAACIAAKCAGKKHILLSVHNIASKPQGIFDRVADYWVRKSVSSVISVSKAAGSSLVSNRGFDKSAIITIYNGIKDNSSPGMVFPVPAGGARSNSHYISMAARFEERKAHEYVLRAFKDLITGYPEYADLKLLLLGEGPLLPKIKKLASAEGIGENIEFLGHRNDCVNYIASSLFLLNPSLEYEGLPYSILEAMSMGVPVIATDVGGITEEIEAGVTGMIVPAADIQALAQAMFILLSDSQKRLNMGAASKKRFSELFTLDRMLKNYTGLYSELAR